MLYAARVSVFGTLIVFFILITLYLIIILQTNLIAFYEAFTLRKRKRLVWKREEKSIPSDKANNISQPVQNNVFGLPKNEVVRGYHFTIGKKEYHVGVEKIEE